MTFADVRSAADVEALATRILEPRETPLVLVSTDADGHFRFDLDQLRNELDGAADIATIKTGAASHNLERFLPPKTHAFGGAARVYPPDFGTTGSWLTASLNSAASCTTRISVHRGGRAAHGRYLSPVNGAQNRRKPSRIEPADAPSRPHGYTIADTSSYDETAAEWHFARLKEWLAE